MKGKKGRILNVASFFSGCGGFDVGFKKAGFNIVLANDIWKPAAESFKANHPEVEFLQQDISEITKRQLNQILKKKRVKKIDVMIGGPPCQCFTRLNNNKLRRDDERNQLFRQYLRMLKLLKPDFVVMENVADLLVRQNEKGQNFRDLIIRNFNRQGYKAAFTVMESEYFGVPQRRRRVIFFATNRKDVDITFPISSDREEIVRSHLNKIKGKKNLKNHEFTINSALTLERIKHVPQGGYYEDLPKRLKVKKVRNGRLVIVKRYGSYFRRLHSKEPAITITNNYLIHPTKDRYLSNREHAILHTFPLRYKLFGNVETVGQQIANAVPPELAFRIAKHITTLLDITKKFRDPRDVSVEASSFK